MSKEQNVINYYVLCNKLKNVIRIGWKDWNVQRDRIESVAEHIYGVQMLAIAMHSEFEYDIDIENTFNNRKTEIKSIDRVISEIEKSEFLKELWAAYRKKHKYANNIEFSLIIEKYKDISKLTKSI